MPRTLLLLSVMAVLLAGVACGSKSHKTSTPSPTGTVVRPTTGTVHVSESTIAIGGKATVSGASWNGSGPVQFYLLTDAQAPDAGSAARAIANHEAPKVGETTTSANGSFSFQFALAASYPTDSGSTLTVTPGMNLTVFALQSSTASLADPFVVR